jgi:hypothetical protein
MIPFAACVPSKVSSLCVRLSVLLAVFTGLFLPSSLMAQITFEPNWVQQSPLTKPSAQRIWHGLRLSAQPGGLVRRNR